jgi:hypothetical protein
MLGARHADRNWKAKLRPHTVPNRACNFSRRTEQMGAASNVRKGLVDGNPLHEWREIIEHIDGRISQPLVVLEMAANEDQVRTKLTRPSSRHAATDAKGPGFV